MLVGLHTGEDEEVLLSALEGINTGHLQLLREGGGEGGGGEGGGREREREGEGEGEGRYMYMYK